ncbi:RNA polymerase sigma factor [Flavilitoribacter nigricans]|uniref:RNA polymerase sigma factor 70 region 4 type 2 domain-containing protein n=1 Tax=Flavilitoribacter nigricans (strain ATCC 23147 / DSM 23189 / NBRC 102662 / NCIMB 1420 / SS-2) TaxID=1122177 RepID=A0A2D0N6E2_FLAN2|nr:RNA polymerase sigma factor [Flavilitoribacter nigricans]PHN04081.1 hypothetical protein CRP01_23065 [Flavilitoribacter nigricans DSM 23189 = NBRC 102662]
MMETKLRRRLLRAMEAKNWELFFNLVYNAYRHKIFAIAVNRQNQLGRVFQPEDVVQDVFLTFYTRYDIYRFTAEKLETLLNLLSKITVNHTYDIDRREGSKHSCYSLNEVPETRNDQEADDFEYELQYSDFLKHLLAELSETQRQVFSLRLNGYPYREIAEDLNLTSEENARQYFQQAKNKLRKLISREKILA